MNKLYIVIVALVIATFTNTIEAQASPKRTLTEYAVNNYPLFDRQMAVELWGKWRKNIKFTPDEYSQTVELCIVSFDYLTEEYTRIANEVTSQRERRRQCVKLDEGIPSEMTNFARAFATRLQNAAVEGELTDEVYNRVALMLGKKRAYLDVFNKASH